MTELQGLDAACDWIFDQVGPKLRLAAPLGLGKPNRLINLIYERVRAQSEMSLSLFTALSLDPPQPSSDLEKRFLQPFLERHFGKNYPRLEYVKDLRAGRLPSNVEVREFYFQAGEYGKHSLMQRNHVCLNYTHVCQALLEEKLNVVIQWISPSKDGVHHSLSCNPDLTLDVVEAYRAEGRPLLMVGVVHPELPVLGGDALVSKEFFDAVVMPEGEVESLFALPKTPVSDEDMMIGLYAGTLVEDGGTLQIGIGSLSDALVHALILRQSRNEEFREIFGEILKVSGDFSKFSKGLYGTSEMVMDGFMHLRRHGILKREIYDGDEKKKRYLHGAFFLGSKEFYRWLSALSEKDADGFSMTRVSKVNDLYDQNEWALRRQRKKARFFNTCMGMTLLGGATSDTLPDGEVISGIGGQYNFVAMAHELADARSILMFRSVREKAGKVFSNLVWEGGHLSIPRHLRDVAVTEYGIAVLKNRTDEGVIRALLNITDSRFQRKLMEKAKRAGKLSEDYEIPEAFRNNTPQALAAKARAIRSLGLFPFYPFGSDFTVEEERLSLALSGLKKKSRLQLMKVMFKGLFKSGFFPELKRLQLDRAGDVKSVLTRALVRGALNAVDEGTDVFSE